MSLSTGLPLLSSSQEAHSEPGRAWSGGSNTGKGEPGVEGLTLEEPELARRISLCLWAFFPSHAKISHLFPLRDKFLMRL